MLGQLHTLLPHLSHAYCIRWGVSSTNKSGKRNATYQTVRKPLTDSLLLDHFDGKNAISVQPLLDDGETCQWGAIDIDTYGDSQLLDRVKKAINIFKIPCFVESSKSGGVHIYIILNQPVIAKPFRRALKKLAVWLGFPRAEIRPAQDQIKVEEGDLGNFIVYPGFGMGVEKVYEALSHSMVDVETFNALTEEGEFIDGPPCLFPLQKQYEATGWQNRNLYLYQLGVFLRYKHPSDWQKRLTEYNDEIITPSLPTNEVAALVSQLEKNIACHYRCSDPMFEAVCNKSSCQIRRYGVAARESLSSMVSAEGISVLDTDPPIWFITLQSPNSNDTYRVKLTTAQLSNVTQFKKRVMEVLKIIPTLPKQKEWEEVVAKLLDSAEILPVPFEMTENAHILDLLYRFCLSHGKSLTPDGIFQGRIFVTEQEDGIFYAQFRSVDFMNYLNAYKNRSASSTAIFTTLNELVRHGKLSQDKVSIPPAMVDVWGLRVESKYMKLKMELDLDED